MSNEIVVSFSNSRMARLPKDKCKFVRLGQRTDEEYNPDLEGGVAVINWDNVAFVREWIEPKEDDLHDTV